MENNNWRPAAPAGGAAVTTAAPGGDATMDDGDWRAQLPPDSRQRIVNKIMDTLKRHLPFSGQVGLQELKKIAVRFEEKIYTAATSQSDYLRKISLKMLTMESKSQSTIPNSANGNKSPDPGASHSMQPHNLGQSLPIPLQANQSQARQHLLSQNLQNNMTSSGVQSSVGLPSAMTSVPSLTQTSIPYASSQNPTMQNIASVPQNTVSNSMGQNMPANMYANAQRQMPGRQQVVSLQQPQSQNPQYLYQQQMIMKQKLQEGNLPHTRAQSHMQQQQQQQSLLQSNQLQSSQQSGVQTSSVMQPSMMQSAPLSSLQQNQPSSVQQSTQSMLQQHPQSVLRQQQQQTAAIHQQHMTMMQQPQQLIGQQSNANNMQQNQLIGQQNSLGDMQQQQQQQLLAQQINLQNLQQQQQQQLQLLGQQINLQNLQQLMAQQNNLSSMHQQQLGSQSNVSGVQQQQQMLGKQSGNPSMQANQQSVHIMQQPKVPMQQQMQQGSTNLLPSQGQQSQPQKPQQQLMSQIQSQSAQLQQPMGLQLRSSPLQRDLQQRLQASGQAPGSMRQAQNVMDQQKQLYQNQRAIQETPLTSLDSTAQTGHANGGDWQEAYQKLKQMKEMYFPEINEMYQKNAAKLQQQQNNTPSLQHNFVPSASIAPTSQQNMFHQLGSASNTDSGQGNARSSLQQITLQQNPATTPQQPNMNTLSSQSAVNMLLPNIPVQSNSSLVQQQYLKQLQEQLLVQNQQREKHYQQWQIPQQLLQKMYQQPKQQLPAPLHAILVFILFILCLLFVVSVLNLWLVL